MKIYAISLARATERRRFISNQLRSLNAEFEIIDAIDYTKMSDEQLLSQCQVGALKSAYPTKGMYACALSHVAAYNRLLAEGRKSALIIEDDAVLPLKTNALLDIIDENIHPEEVVLLSYYGYRKGALRFSRKATVSLPNELELATPVEIDAVRSAMAYAITASVASKMIEAATPVSATADNWEFFYKRGAFKTLRCIYPLQVRAEMFVSTIDYADSTTWKFKMKSFLRKYSRLEPLFRARDAMRQSRKYSYQFTEEIPFDQVTT